MGVRLQRGDLGIALGAVAAVVLIGGFLAATSGSPDEDEDAAPPTTTEAPRSGLVRVTSDADADRAWSTARGSFRVECQDGRVQWLDAKVVDLPIEPRYGWRIVVDEETGETAPLTRRPGMTTTLTQGDGLASAFRPTAAGRSTVRFTFSRPRQDLPVDLVLTVLQVEPEQARVIAVPAMTCRAT